MPSDLGATGDRPSLAPPRLAAPSALALRPPAGLASIDRRDSGADRHHGERGTGSGAQRIRGELLKLGIVVSSRSIRRFRRRRPSRPPSQSWRALPRQPCSGDLGRRPLRRPDPHLPDAPTSSSLSVMAAASFFTTKYLCRQVLSVGCVADVPLSPRSSKLCS